MEERFSPVNPTGVDLREYRGVLWGTVALIALNVALALPTGAAKAPVESAALVEKVGTEGGAKLLEDAEGSDDVMTELAAAPVASKELSKLRGGFRTRSGMEISVGFDFKTFLNGKLQVHNIFNVVGSDHRNRSRNTAVAGRSQSVTGNPGGSSNSFQTSIPVTVVNTVVPEVANTVTDAVNTATNAANGAQTPPTTTTPPVSQSTAPVSTAAAPTVEPIIINEITSGKITVVNQISPGTIVTNTIDNGKINTIVQNVAEGVTIDQITSLSIGITKPSDFISSFRSGRRSGVGGGVSNVMRSALLGAIAR